MSEFDLDHFFTESSDDMDPESFIESINQTSLPSPVHKFSQRYIEEEIGDRNVFIWKWLYKVFEHYQLKTMPNSKSKKARTIKTLLAMFVTIFDDVAEESHDRATFEQIRIIPTPTTPQKTSKEVNQSVISILCDLHAEITEQLAETPRYEIFEHMFRYDIHQAINSGYYSMLVNESIRENNINIMTPTGLDNYDCHNMCFFAFSDIDLMIDPEIDMEDIGLIREVNWDVQQMARIGNWVSTWEREIYEEDFSSGIIACALQRSVTNIEQLQNDPEAAIEAIEATTIESEFVEKWRKLHTKIQTVDDTANSIDLNHFADRMKTVMMFHLASEGYK